MDAEQPSKTTGIPCFVCGERSGIDCPGRKPDEATRCEVCLKAFMEDENKKQIEHLRTIGPTAMVYDSKEWVKTGGDRDERFWKEATVFRIRSATIPASLQLGPIDPNKKVEVCDVIFHDNPHNPSQGHFLKDINKGKGLSEDERQQVPYRE